MNEITHKQQIEKHTKLILNVLNTLDENKVKDLKKNGKTYEYDINEDKFFVIDAPTVKVCISENYNYTFDKINGDFKRWGNTYEDDPQFSPVFAEIADIEITTACSGALTKINGKEIRKPCAFCYKSNTPNGYNMSFETFKKIIDKTPNRLDDIIVLEDINGKTIEVEANAKVRLADGSETLAKNIKENDDIVSFYKGSELVFLE